MKEKVLFVILDKYADWEGAFLSTALNGKILEQSSPYEAKTVSLTKDAVTSIGGFTTVPDYGIDDVPSDFAALVLIGGWSWRTEDAKKLAPFILKAFSSGKIVAAICDAVSFLGINGILNDKKHTANNFDDLVGAAKKSGYSGEKLYINEQVVRDGNLITANGTGYLEFTREVLSALNAYPQDLIESNYQFFKLGYIEFLKTLAKK